MRFSRQRLTKGPAIAVVAVMLGVVGALAACTPKDPPQNSGCGKSSPAASSMRRVAATSCFTADDFICGGGSDCFAELKRPACDIGPCPEVSFNYSLKGVTAKAGEQFAGVESGHMVLPANASSVRIPIKTFPDRIKRSETVRLEISVGGVIVNTATGTLTP